MINEWTIYSVQFVRMKNKRWSVKSLCCVSMSKSVAQTVMISRMSQFLYIRHRFGGLFVYNFRWAHNNFEPETHPLKFCSKWHPAPQYSMCITEKPPNLVLFMGTANNSRLSDDWLSLWDYINQILFRVVQKNGSF